METKKSENININLGSVTEKINRSSNLKLIPTTISRVDSCTQGKDLVSIHIANIYPDPGQPRTEFDENKVVELAASIFSVGLIQPIKVAMKQGTNPDDKFLIGVGERRWRAFNYLRKQYKKSPEEFKDLPTDNWNNILCIIDNDIQNINFAAEQIIENMHREGLSVLEEALAFEKMIATSNTNGKKLSKLIGKSENYVYQRLNIIPLLKDISTNTINKLGITVCRELNVLLGKNEIAFAEFIKSYDLDNLSNKEIQVLLKEQINIIANVSIPKQAKPTVSTSEAQDISDQDPFSDLEEIDLSIKKDLELIKSETETTSPEEPTTQINEDLQESPDNTVLSTHIPKVTEEQQEVPDPKINNFTKSTVKSEGTTINFAINKECDKIDFDIYKTEFMEAIDEIDIPEELTQIINITIDNK